MSSPRPKRKAEDEILVADTEHHDDVVEVERTSALQRFSQVAYSYTVDGVAMTTVLTTEFIPDVLPQPYKEMVRTGLVLADITTMDAIHAVTERKHPFSGFDAFTPVKYTLSFIPPVATSVGVGFLIEAYGPAVMASNNPALQVVGMVLQNPLAHTGVTALVAYAEFGLTKKLIECCKKPGQTNEEAGRNLLQIGIKVVTNVVEPIAMYEALRMTLLMAGQEGVLHNQYFPLIVVGFDQMLKMWGHMSRIPHPMEDLAVKEERRPQASDEESLLGHDLQPSRPSNSAIAKGVAYYGVRFAVVATAVSYGTLELLNYMQAETDQEKLESRDRLLNLVALTGAVGVGEQVADLTVKLGGFIWSKVSSNCSSMFGGRRQPISTPVVEEVQENTLRKSQ